jgi:hypothetical protein
MTTQDKGLKSGARFYFRIKVPYFQKFAGGVDLFPLHPRTPSAETSGVDGSHPARHQGLKAGVISNDHLPSTASIFAKRSSSSLIRFARSLLCLLSSCTALMSGITNSL